MKQQAVPPNHLVLLALVLATLLGCVTQVPRPEASQPLATPTSVPAVATPFVPTSTPTRELPTATAPPTPSPTPGRVISPTLPSDVPTLTLSGTTSPAAFKLEVFAPDDGATVPGEMVVVYGVTEPGARVFVSGTETEVDAQGGFREVIPLQQDSNIVEIVAMNEDGLQTAVSRRVTALALPFLLLITEPESQSIVSSPTLPLSGRTGPNAVVSINARSVPVDRFGYFSASILLEEGPNFIDVVATNDDGRTLSQIVAVIFRPPLQ